MDLHGGAAVLYKGRFQTSPAEELIKLVNLYSKMDELNEVLVA